MKTKVFVLIVLLLSATSAYSQLIVNADGSTTFKVGSFFAGFTGNSANANVSLGYQALNSSPTAANNNVGIGYAALTSVTSGFGNTAIGGGALRYTVGGYYNTGIGEGALISNTSGSSNTAVGIESLYYNTTGNYNTAVGGGLHANTTGYYNNAFGTFSLPSNTTGSNNAGIGDGALPHNTTGDYNVGLGSWALTNNTTGSFNIGIGDYTTVDVAGNLNNVIAIGHQTTVTSSNTAQIGNTSTSTIGGYTGWTNFSDGRAKKNIQTNVPGLAFINQLQPITYNLDLDAIDGLLKVDKADPRAPSLSPELEAINKKAREDKEKIVQTGFIAQDVEKSAQSLGYDFSGVDVDEVGIYGLRYAEFVVPLVKAVQELSAQVNELTALVAVLQEKDAPDQLRSGSTGEAALPISGASLQQNSPNPFSQTTVIRYTLPKTDKQAQIIVSNTAGNIVKQIPLDETGSVTIEGGSLSAGIYYYSLYVGSGLIDTKKMILTK
jgi:hypothetical protein